MEFTDKDISDVRIGIYLGAEVYILVEAPGYEDRGMVVAPKVVELLELSFEMTQLVTR